MEWMSVSCDGCCQVEDSATGRSFVQRSHSDCGVSECDIGTSTVRPWPLGLSSDDKRKEIVTLACYVVCLLSAEF